MEGALIGGMERALGGSRLRGGGSRYAGCAGYSISMELASREVAQLRRSCCKRVAQLRRSCCKRIAQLRCGPCMLVE
jgi:hypothetical protein